MNFTPYNLAFLIHDKAHYFKARKVLLELTEKTESPTDEEIEKSATQKGLRFQELSFTDVKSGMDFFDQVVKKYHLRATPTLVIVNTRTGRYVKLEGGSEITEKNVMTALKKMENS
jgi:hypothetical protein